MKGTVMFNQFVRRLSDVFSNLSTPFTVFDGTGTLLFGNVTKEVQPPLNLHSGDITTSQGFLFLRVDLYDGIILMTPASDFGGDSLLMAAALARALGNKEDRLSRANSAYHSVLTGHLPMTELEALINEYGMPREAPRCVIIISMTDAIPYPAADMLRNMLPMEDGDVLVDISKPTAALIKTISGAGGMDEMGEFAAAIQETALSEEGLAITIGIGSVVQKVQELPASFSQANTALSIGRLFRPTDSIFVYHNMLLERFLAEVPQETAAHYHALLFNRKTMRLFSDEMLDTINMFLAKDLNLSDTARQMYIHRNTLVYRLDKVQKQTWLDLRSFRDAVTFKLLYEMKKNADLRNSLSISQLERK